MELIVQQRITLKNKHKMGDFFTARKTYESVEFLPKIGDAIEDSVYHRNAPEYKVVSTSFNYEENYYIAYLDTITIDSDDRNDIEKEKELYRLHKWEVLNA